MKRTVFLITALLLFCALTFAACGDKVSMDAMKQRFKDEGYTLTTMSKSDIDKTAGLVEGFSFSGGNTSDGLLWAVSIYKFSTKTLAEEYKDRNPPKEESSEGAFFGVLCSLKGEVYFCKVSYSSLPDSAEPSVTPHPDMAKVQAAIAIFDSFFK